ncbi:hypothetical protein [Flavobacterium sp.]|uniref:hypothetical protein n=1 Tax=Flavobacterium sp. TaxID=239 RepID=UPI0025E2C78D|nr:hypothetical protein [Flavobacterium sp.]
MKHLLLITVMVFALCPLSSIHGQSAIEIKSLSGNASEVSSENHTNSQFEILANEDSEVDLKFSLKLEEDIIVSVKDQQNRLIVSKRIKKNDKKRLVFLMNQNERYVVNVTAAKQTNLMVHLSGM